MLKLAPLRASSDHRFTVGALRVQETIESYPLPAALAERASPNSFRLSPEEWPGCPCPRGQWPSCENPGCADGIASGIAGPVL